MANTFELNSRLIKGLVAEDASAGDG